MFQDGGWTYVIPSILFQQGGGFMIGYDYP
jgi:hypothetical protein